MSRKPEKILMIDTETANGLDDPLVYDVGGMIIDRKGNCYEAFSFMNTDVLNDAQVINTAYYAEKLPRYWEDARQGKRIISNTFEIKQYIAALCEKWNVVAICAHNARFDVNALNTTQRWETKSRFRYFLPFGIPIWDTMLMVQDVVVKTPTYIKFCDKHGYRTKNKQVRKTAEILYQYISKNDNFVEAHTGLEDVQIESQILAYCFRKHKKMRKALYTAK